GPTSTNWPKRDRSANFSPSLWKLNSCQSEVNELKNASATMVARKNESAVSDGKILLRFIAMTFFYMRRRVICFKFRARVLTMSDLTKERTCEGRDVWLRR